MMLVIFLVCDLKGIAAHIYLGVYLVYLVVSKKSLKYIKYVGRKRTKIRESNNRMKILITADIHAYKHKEFPQKRLYWCLDALQKMRTYAVENKCSHFFILGDLFHAHIQRDPDTYVQTVQVIKTIAEDMKVVILTGTHELVNEADPRTNFLTPLDGEDIYIINEHEYWSHADYELHLLPFIPDKERYEEELHKVDKSDYNTKILFSHIGVQEALLSNDYIIEDGIPASSFKDFHLAILGHYHRQQFVEPNILYVGAPIQHNFGEEGEPKRFLILDLDNHTLDSIPIKGAPTFHKMSIFTERDNLQLRDMLEKGETYIQATAKNKDVMADLIKLSHIYPNLSLVMDYEEKKKINRLSLSGVDSDETIFTKYMKVKKPERMEQILEKGLDIIRNED